LKSHAKKGTYVVSPPPQKGMKRKAESLVLSFQRPSKKPTNSIIDWIKVDVARKTKTGRANI
jgi:hypothetical protein